MKQWGCFLKRAIFVVFLVCIPCIQIKAAGKQTIYNSPYVNFSGDGTAWTTNAGEQKYEWYPYGETVSTGIKSSLRALQTGEHYYKVSRQGELPIGEWKVVWRNANCIHIDYPPAGNKFHDVTFARNICLKPHFSGWIPYCADCGEMLTDKLVYMSRNAAASIDYLEVGMDFDYYYLCPYCMNLEQGVPVEEHICKDISWNSYLVRYDQNTTELCGGTMPSSRHIYNNGTEYEGEKVTPITHLTMNNFTRVGYEFAGWNTKPNGSGTAYKDGAKILNLTDKDLKMDGDDAIVTLYAQWQKSQSTLIVDPNGGTYDGKTSVTKVVGKFGEQYLLSTQKVVPPKGYTVCFQTNGGKAIPPITGSRHFSEWEREQPFKGEMHTSGERGIKYVFCTADGNVDTVKAAYEPDPVRLPSAVRTGFSFGGWYYDAAFTFPAGGTGDSITPVQDVTLYAQWVDLVLASKENYTANKSRGAVDLTWSQSDGKNKVYRIYQSRDMAHWWKIDESGDIGDNLSVNRTYNYSGASGRYTVPYTGLYHMTLDGAQGENYGNFRGGYGGSVSAKVWLMKGEILEFCIGGQNGYNGGGSASAYGRGGGYSILSSDKKGVLLIAGGGGGASPGGDGGSGGSTASVISGRDGQDGYAGGGGGNQGGTAGELILHHHTSELCPYHTHAGNTAEGGGCYQMPVTFTGTCTYIDQGWRTDNACGVVYCSSCKASSQGTNHCHWYAHSSCGQAGGHWGYTTCGKGHTVHSWGSFYSGTHPYPITTYELSCGVQEGWNCQYEEGQVISSMPACGGSNYVNGEHACSQTSEMGVRSGNGVLKIQSEVVGFVDKLELFGVTATDFAPPEQIKNVQRNPVSATQIEICWEEPKDKGTVYYHYAESLLKGSANPLCRSNRVQNTLTSGVKGYYVLADTKADTVVNAGNGTYQAKPNKTEVLKAGQQYLHVAAVDAAGNIGVTAHIPFGMAEDVEWKLFTKQMEIAEGENVYPASEKGTYYVRSDGSTPFLLRTDSFLDGTASKEYQINYSIYESFLAEIGADEASAQNIIKTPSADIRDDEIRTEAGDLIYSTEGAPLLSLYPYSYTVRSNRNRNLSAVQKFTLSMDASGKRIKVIPRAGADRNSGVVRSSKNADVSNGIVLIGDSKAPEITGLEVLNDKELINRPDGTVTLNVSAQDDLSGVRNFYAKIVNADNRVEEIYSPDDNGRIEIDITRDKPIFSGDFVVTVYVVDNVGNEREITVGTTEFALAAEVERILEPHDPAFKCGESGILTITTWGYAERVEVEFPQEMTALNPALNQVFDYSDAPEHVKIEKLQFMVPLNTPENKKYTITVRAYKGDKRLEDHPAMSTVEVEGSVLDELRTRLR